MSESAPSPEFPMDIYTDAQCLHYGSFMHTVPRLAAEAMYWSFFVFVLFLLFSSSWRFGTVMEKTDGLRVGDPVRQGLVIRCYWMAIAIGFLSLLTAILECFALLTLQFCDQEPLISLYWSTWTVLQVGAVVAIFGIALHTRHMIRGRRPPPWALALGTPVLVVAGLGHYVSGKIKRGGRKVVERSRSRHSRGRRRYKDEPLSEAPTVRGDSSDTSRAPFSDVETATPTMYDDASEKFNARIMGYTEEGDVIIRISPERMKELISNTNAHPRPPKLALSRTASVKWDEKSVSAAKSPTTPAVPPINIAKSEVGVEQVENRILRPGETQHRLNSSVTFKEPPRINGAPAPTPIRTTSIRSTQPTRDVPQITYHPDSGSGAIHDETDGP